MNEVNPDIENIYEDKNIPYSLIAAKEYINIQEERMKEKVLSK